MIPDFGILTDLIAAIVAVLLFVGISRFIKKLFSIDLYLNISPHQTICKFRNQEIAIETALFISEDGKKPRILGIGSDVPKEPYKKINVFSNNESKTFEESKEIISAFFRTAFRQLTNKKRFHPFIKAKIAGIKTLEPIFGGDTKDLIQNSLKDAFVVKFDYID
jgi:hypothetical protein